MEDDIIGELRSALARRAWRELATTLETTDDLNQRAAGYEWLRSTLVNGLRNHEGGVRLLASLLSSLVGEREAVVIELQNNMRTDRRHVALGDDGILRERLGNSSEEHAWNEVVFRSLVRGMAIPERWVIMHRIQAPSGDGLYLEGEDGSYWQLLYGAGHYPDRWVLNRWSHGRYDPES